VGVSGDVVDLNGGRWSPDPPEVEASVTAMLAVAAREVDEDQFARWLRDRVVFDG
jgi:prophage maintenance system killer protein